MALTQMDKDLGEYAERKLVNAIKDVTQAFEIAGEGHARACACVGAKMLQMAAQLCVYSTADPSPEKWARVCAEVFAQATRDYVRHKREVKGE